jgi:hypothetical protein
MLAKVRLGHLIVVATVGRNACYVVTVDHFVKFLAMGKSRMH